MIERNDAARRKIVHERRAPIRTTQQRATHQNGSPGTFGIGARLIELFDAIGLAAFIVVGVVVALDTSAQPLWLWGPIAAVITASFGGLMRDLYRHDRVTANLGGELYPEIASVCGLALAVFLGWEGERLQPDEIKIGVIVTISAAFLIRMVAVARGTKGWRFV